jgi:hypothetical protein
MKTFCYFFTLNGNRVRKCIWCKNQDFPDCSRLHSISEHRTKIVSSYKNERYYEYRYNVNSWVDHFLEFCTTAGYYL